MLHPKLGENARNNGHVIYSLDFEVTPHQLRHTFENLTAFRQGTFTLFAEHKEPVAPAVPQAKAYDLGYGHLGNGLTVWNRLEEEHRDYKTVAHIAPDRTVTIYDEELPQAVREEIQRIADTSEMTISATQDAPVFAVPPRVQEPPQKEELADPSPELAAQVLRFVGEFDGSRMGYDGRSNEYRITLKGTLSHTVTLGTDVFGNITRLDNALENLAGSLQAEQNNLEETKTQLENARTELAAPFAREEELAEKTKRLKELNILLNMDEKDKTLMDDGPDEGEEVPARKVVELAR